MIANLVSYLNDEELWAKYLQDFIKVKCVQTETIKMLPEEFLQNFTPVISAYFGFHQKKKHDHVLLLATVHVYSEIQKTDLAQTMNMHQRLIQHQETSSIVAQSFASSIRSIAEGNLGTIIVSETYDSLCRIIKSHNNDDALKQWYLTYRDIVSSKLHVIFHLYNT